MKAALDAEGIDYAGMTFTEGISKTQLTSDDSQLPTNVMYKGQPTNNLVMLLTNTTKNIASGAEPLTRKEIYTIIRENNLSEDLKEEFGNWTIITTEALEEFIRNNYNIIEDKEEEDTEEEEVEAPHPDLVECTYAYIKDMYDEQVLEAEDIFVLADLLDEFADSLEDDDDKKEAPRHHAEITDADTNNKIDEILEGI